jgi:hypothetical protein
MQMSPMQGPPFKNRKWLSGRVHTLLRPSSWNQGAQEPKALKAGSELAALWLYE